MKEECIFIALIVSFVRIWNPTVRLKPAGNDAAFKRFGFEWQMLYKTNYPQEDENTFHLLFQSMFGLHSRLFILWFVEKHAYYGS